MQALPPGFVLDQQGPIVGPPPKAPAPASPEELRRLQLAEQAAARADRAEARAQEAHEANMNKGTATGGDQKAAQKAANLDALVTQINRVQELFNSGQRDNAIPILGSLMEYLPLPENQAFDAASAGLAEQGLAAFRVPGVGAQSDTELRQFTEANKPSSWSSDASNLERLRQLRLRVESTRKAMGLPPAEWVGLQEQVDQSAPIARGGAPEAAAPTVLADPQSTRFVTDDDKRRAAELNQAFRQGASANELIAIMARHAQETGAALTPDKIKGVNDALQFRAQNGPYDAFVPGMGGEKTDLQQAVSSAADSPLGAYLTAAGQFVSGNTLDNFAENPELARQALAANQAAYPIPSTAGEITGGIGLALGGEGILAAQGVRAGIGRGLASDTLAGIAQGLGMGDDGNRLASAAQGGLSSLIGSGAGAGITRGVARAVNPTGGNLAELYQAGVRPTLGQRVANANDGKGFTGMVGRAVNATEERLQSVPIVGSAIQGARQDARDQFQIGAFNESLREIGLEIPKGMKPGTDPNKFAQKAFAEAYDTARSGMTMVADTELANDLSALAPDIQTLGPQAQNKLKAILENSINSKMVNGTLSGDAYKKAVSDLGKHIARQGKGLMADDQALAEILGNVQSALDAAARRHSDSAAVELLDAADAGYAKLVRIEEAAMRRGGDAGTFSPANFDSAVQKTSGGVRSKAYLRGDALMQDFAAAGRSLEDTVPNSGTPERMAVAGAAAGGLAYIEPSTLAILGGLGAAYAPGVRKVTTSAMAPGGKTRKAISDFLAKRARLIGAASGATAIATQ